MTDTGTQLLEALYKALDEKHNKPREKTHVSDIIICPREQVFRRLRPQKADNTSLGFFTSGEAIGSALQALATSNPDKYKAEFAVTFDGLEAHIDLYDLENNIPIECKSYNGADMDQPKEHYVTQLRAYMAMLGATKGIILVQLLQRFRSKKGQNGKPFKTWVITMDEQQIKDERKRLIQERKQFEQAIAAKDPSLARHVMGTETAWKCNYCKFLTECQAINKKAVVAQ